MKKLAIAILIMVTTFAATAVWAMGERGGPPAETAQVGKAAPDFTITDLDGKSVSLSQYRGKVVFLNFWATWCPPCREEMPSMERLREAMNGRDFVILAVNVEKEGAAAVAPYIRKHGYNFPVLIDDQAVAQEAYRVFRYPESFLIDKEGTVLQHYLGGRDWSSVEFLKYVSSLAAG